MRIQYIDGLKAIGAFMVYFCHFYGLFHISDLPNCLTFINNGEFAVSIFLMLSGFSISMSLSRDDSKTKVQSIILFRYFRFALPMAVVTTIAYVIYLFDGYHVSDVAHLIGRSLGIKDYVHVSFYNYFASLIWAPMSYNILNSPLWMMKYIFEGTFIIIILHLGVIGIQPLKKYMIFIVSMILSVMESIYLTNIICGMMIYHLWNDHNRNFVCIRMSWVYTIILLCLSLYIAVYYRRDGINGISLMNQLFLLTGSASLIIAVFMSGIIQKILSSRLFLFIGDISFELYLVHWIFLCSFSSWFWLHYNNPLRDNMNYLNFVLTTMIVIGFAFVLKKYVEPFVCNPVEKRIKKLLFRNNL